MASNYFEEAQERFQKRYLDTPERKETLDNLDKWLTENAVHEVPPPDMEAMERRHISHMANVETPMDVGELENCW